MTQNFLLVDLNEKKTKKLAETITSDTSRKILNHLADKDDSEKNISTSMKIPISTVHYHLQKLQEAGLVTVEEFHYSEKGRVINHYKLANKYIITLDIITGNNTLGWNVNYLFAHLMYISGAVEKWNQEIESGLQGFRIFSQPFNNDIFTLRHNYESFENQKYHYNDKNCHEGVHYIPY